MKGQDKNHVFILLSSLDRKLSIESSNSRARKAS